jgi:hypothetical protein
MALEKTANTIYDLHDAVNGYIHKKDAQFFGGPAPDGAVSDTLAEIDGAGEYKIKNQKRQPMNKTTRNPIMEEPSALAQKKFGQLPTSKIAIDNVFPKIIGVFMSETHGGGMSAFNFSNLPTFAGSQQLIDVVSKIVTGSGATPSAGMQNPIIMAANKIASLAGADISSQIDLSRPDHMIPFMNAAAAGMAGVDTLTDSPFTTDTFAQSALIAAQVQQNLTDESGGASQYSQLLEQVAEGLTDEAIAILKSLPVGDSEISYILNLLEQLRNATDINQLIQIRDALSGVPFYDDVANSIATVNVFNDVVDLGNVTAAENTLRYYQSISEVREALNEIVAINDKMDTASFIQLDAPLLVTTAIPALGKMQQFQSLLGNLSNMQSFTNLTNMPSQMQNIASLPQALTNAINILGLSAGDTKAKLQQLTAAQGDALIGRATQELNNPNNTKVTKSNLEDSGLF